jgi:small conductance mechanosensitive channel
VNIVTRAWVKAADFWPVYFELNKKVYKTFAAEGLTIPFPQMDVHLKGGEEVA